MWLLLLGGRPGASRGGGRVFLTPAGAGAGPHGAVGGRGAKGGLGAVERAIILLEGDGAAGGAGVGGAGWGALLGDVA